MRDYLHNCRQPQTASETRGRWGEAYPKNNFVAIGLLLSIALAIQGFLIYVLIDGWRTDQTGFETDGPGFPLYKNTIAEECYLNDTITTPGLCSSLARHLESDALKGRETFLDSREYTWDGTQSKLNATWCQGFKIIPSEPLPAAYWPNRFASWNSGNTAAVAYLATFAIYLHDRKYNYPKGCRGFKSIGVATWITMAYAIAGPFAWWWTSIFRQWRNNSDWSTASFAAWTVTWHQVYNLHYQPRSCVLALLPRAIGRLIKCIAWLLVVAQCAATAYFVIDWPFMTKGFMPRRGYDCLASSIASAPGSSSCTPDYLCSPEKEWMLQSRDFQQGQRFFYASIFPPLHFCLSILAVAVPYVPALYQAVRKRRGLRRLKFQTREKEEIPLYLMAFVASISLICSLVNVILVAANNGATAMEERNDTARSLWMLSVAPCTWDLARGGIS